MKKLSFIVMACLMVLGLAQCKKNEPTNNNNADDADRVSITLTLDNGGQRVHLVEDPATGWANVVYDNGDKVYVGSDGKYMGCLTYNGSVFVGDINAEAAEGQPLQFIFMGGKTIDGLTENSSTECTFSIGDQSNSLPVISCAASNENFSATKLDYTAYLRNKCALVKFDLGEVSTDAAITLTGMKTEVTIGFDGTVNNGTATGDIVTYGTGTTRYAVVLSDQAAVTNGTLSAEGYEGTFSIPTAAYTNAFLTNASMTLTSMASYDIVLGHNDIGDLYTGDDITLNGITIAIFGGNEDGEPSFLNYDLYDYADLYLNEWGGISFTSTAEVGRITKIVFNYTGGKDDGFGIGCTPNNWIMEDDPGIFTLSGDPTYSVQLFGYYGEIDEIRTIVITIE